MKKIILFFSLYFSLFISQSMAQGVVTTPNTSPKAMVMQSVGLTEISITYHRPSVNEREIWGGVVPFGQVWRAGANDNTIIEFSTDVMIEGQSIPAGKYGLHMIPNENEWTIIFSTNYTSWGSYFYQESEDALRVNVTPKVSSTFYEQLTYSFQSLESDKATVLLNWENMEVAFEVAISNLSEMVLANIRKELRTLPAFTWMGSYSAAQYCLQNEINYEEALQWIDQSIRQNKNFSNLSLKAQLLTKTSKEAEADEIIEEAKNIATVFELHQYGRSLIAQGDADKAMDIFEFNAQKHPNTWPIHVGLGRGYSAKGDYKKAIKEFEMALENAPDELNKNSLTSMIQRLENEEDIN